MTGGWKGFVIGGWLGFLLGFGMMAQRLAETQGDVKQQAALLVEYDGLMVRTLKLVEASLCQTEDVKIAWEVAMGEQKTKRTKECVAPPK